MRKMRPEMSYEIYYDLASLRFIRCLRPLPGRDAFAAGAGVSIRSAVARCESEWIERRFEIEELRGLGIVPAGIAAHPDRLAATENAYFEATENYIAGQIAASKVLTGIPLVRALKFEWWITRTSNGYFSIIRTSIDGVPFVAHSAGKSLFHVLIKTWEEYRNPLCLNPGPESLATYSKLAIKIGANSIPDIRFTVSLRKIECPPISSFDVQHVQRGSHSVVYLTTGKGEPTT